jgi:hypothetical protein
MHRVNLADWMTHKDDFGLMLLLGPVVDRDDVIMCEEDRADSMAIPLNCDQERSNAIVQFIRKRYKRHELRIYHSASGDGSWRRV